MRIGVVLAGGASLQSPVGEPGGPTAVQVVPPVLAESAAMADAVVVAADSGLDLAIAGLVPTLVVGDFDSVSADGLAWARERGIEIRTFSTDKDETDLDLALGAAREAGAERLILLGGAGGRLDHLLGNIGAVARVGSASDLPVEAWLGSEYLAVVRAGAEWSAAMVPGAIVSVLAWGGPAVVSEVGVRWPLGHQLLPPGSTHGISNEALGPEGGSATVRITVHEGCALVIVPTSKDLT